MKRYINTKTAGKTETIDEFNSTDYSTIKEFNAAIATRVGSYRMTFKSSDVYVSSRSTKDWTGN